MRTENPLPSFHVYTPAEGPKWSEQGMEGSGAGEERELLITRSDKMVPTFVSPMTQPWKPWKFPPRVSLTLL